MFNQEILKQELEQYKKALPKRWKKEKHKWEAIQYFQTNWKIDAENFSEMLKDVLGKTGKLLTSLGQFPGAMVFTLVDQATEETRRMYKALFNDKNDVVDRIMKFKGQSAQLCTRYAPGISHYNDERDISTYIWLNFPDKYPVYKFNVWNEINNVLEGSYQLRQGEFENNLHNFYNFSEELRTYICADKTLTKILQKLLTSKCYPDSNCVTLTMDFADYVFQKSRQNDDGKDSKDSNDSNAENESGGTTSHAASTGNAGVNYWWLNCKPSIWSMSGMDIGGEQHYTFYTPDGHPRHILQNFRDAKVGDIVLGYESSPIQKVGTVFEVLDIHDEIIYFKKVRNLDNPVDLATLTSTPELQDLEFVKKRFIGSFFKVTKNEYDCIMNLAGGVINGYGKENFLEEVFMSEERYDYLVGVLEDKKNIILKGVPGVGKTFAAKRLAYSIMGEKDESKIKLIQFHQNYSYEDFMMGYKPSDDGKFILKNGVFYRFCLEARKEPDKKYFFIIDEINRGNMSKIFGELLMLLEKDYRDKEKITLPYRDEEFSVPNNLYIIGMMNTADRSLAMLDYALRRRFAHFELEPSFDSEQFTEYKENLGNPIFNNLIDKIKELNVAISEDNSLGKDFRIGHSYFCNLKADECTPEKMMSIVKFEIVPMLEEYWFDDNTQVEKWEKELYEVLNVNS